MRSIKVSSTKSFWGTLVITTGDAADYEPAPVVRGKEPENVNEIAAWILDKPAFTVYVRLLNCTRSLVVKSSFKTR